MSASATILVQHAGSGRPESHIMRQCGLLCTLGASLFGCGIVYDSQPRAEFGEMRLKGQPLLEALGVGAPPERRAMMTCALEN
jgi:hypothetical protein